MESSVEEIKSERRKGGRPPKKIKKECFQMVRLTETNQFLIRAKAKQAGLTVSAFMRQAAIQAKVVARLTPDDLKIFRELAGMANNLNQLTHLAHRDGLLIIQKKCRDLLSEVDITIKHLNGDDRKSDNG